MSWGRPLGVPDFPIGHSPFERGLSDSLKGWCKRIANRANETVGANIASAATITPDHPVHHVTGTAAINTIAIAPGSLGTLKLIPDGAFTLGTSGNIAKASTAVVGQVMELVYDPNTLKWYPSY